MIRSGWLFIVGAIAIGFGGCGPASQSAQSPPGGTSSPERTIRTVREAAVVGMFYPRRQGQLAEDVDRYLAGVKPAPVKNLRGMVCPHAGYQYSGPVAAVAYKQLAGRDVETVVVMASSHYAAFEGGSIPDVDAYRTPLGLVPLASRARELAGVAPFVRNPRCEVGRPSWWRQSPKELPPFGEDTPHTWEHSLEVQLPFLQRTLDDFALLPIVFGRADAKRAAEVLDKHLDARTLLVASSDLSHHFPYERAVEMDTSCTAAICDLDVERMETEDACGKLPILTLMHLAKMNGWEAKLLDYRNSGDTAGDKSSVVGYAAIVFFDPDGEESPAEPETSAFTPDEGETLLELAATTVEQAVKYGVLPSIEVAEMPERLRQRRACFVTLTKGGALRGCIGSIFPQEPLCQAVIRQARNAALEDTRFRPVEKGELEELEIEVSVLTVPERLEFESPDELLRKLRPYTDGVVLQIGRRQSTYLPQVWEKLPAPEAFLGQLSQKAGLPSDAWKGSEAIVLIYQVQEFHRSEI
jgi:AmmeMemoRadiSam system protein A